jgi:hypothetical protein
MTLPKTPTSPSASSEQRFIVVLGAGRSGTSTITRGLRALGVELGDHVMRSVTAVLRCRDSWHFYGVVNFPPTILTSEDFLLRWGRSS